MKLLRLSMSNFLSYSKQEIDFKSLTGVVFFVGKIEDDVSKSNGSGKSAIFDAISWCLFGKSRTSSDEELIRIGEKEMYVDLEFQIDDKTYSIFRSKKIRKSQTLAFHNMTADVKLTGNAVKETQEKIIEVLGIDDELYENTVFARQGMIDAFPRQNPAKRKAMLRDILKLDVYESWESEAKDLAKSYEGEYNSLQSLIEPLEQELSVVTLQEFDLEKKRVLINQAQDKIKRIDGDIAAKQESFNQVKTSKQLLDRERQNHDKLSDDIVRVNSQINYIDTHQQDELDKILKEKETDIKTIEEETRIKGIIAEIEKKMKAGEESRAQYEAMVTQSKSLENEMLRMQSMIKDYDTEIDKLRAKYDKFNEMGDKCPLCYSVINDEQKKKVESEIVTEGKSKKDQRNKLNDEYEKAKVTLKKLKDEINKVNTGFGKSREMENDKEKYDRQLLSIQVAKSRVEFVDNKISDTKSHFMKQKLELNFELKRKNADLEKSVELMESYKGQLKDVDKIETELHGMQEIRNTYDVEEKKLTEELHRMEYQLEERKRKEKELVTHKRKMEKVNQEYFTYTELAQAFGKNGIPLYIVENALAELQSEVMNQLSALTDGAISIEFQTQKELKSGKTSDSMDIIVSDKSGSRDFNLYSGGEKMRIALAIRLGLSKLLSRRAGKKFEVLIIDEVSDLDTHGMNKFVELIGHVAKEYKQVFVVSHINELKDSFGRILQVVKSREGSRIDA